MKAEKHKQKQLLGVKHGWFWAACDASSHGLMATWVGAEDNPEHTAGKGWRWESVKPDPAWSDTDRGQSPDS